MDRWDYEYIYVRCVYQVKCHFIAFLAKEFWSHSCQVDHNSLTMNLSENETSTSKWRRGAWKEGERGVGLKKLPRNGTGWEVSHLPNNKLVKESFECRLADDLSSSSFSSSISGKTICCLLSGTLQSYYESLSSSSIGENLEKVHDAVATSTIQSNDTSSHERWQHVQLVQKCYGWPVGSRSAWWANISSYLQYTYTYTWSILLLLSCASSALAAKKKATAMLFQA